MTDTTPLDAPAASETEPAAAALPRPRIRVGAVLWGLVLVALAAFALWLGAGPDRRLELLQSLLALSPLGWTVVVLVALGSLTTLLALAAVLRRLQHRPR
ncbi:hypothetical protein [Protaetiibacter intestinalis]|uniref:Uncharacterized protein n=1 Tax=Protaetiibacter intestinalis TaxID=2419774 RepID=A0A387B3K6_9MICO|nr:hypothetical protein [Protaetiibacter intestinalis]AYF98152.1 hypothetical protein D7I47_07725 [Protaetiibacter intestinalis]